MIAAGDRLAAVFSTARSEKRAALIVYLVAGDPDAATTAAVIDAISPSVDLIELGIPYGDPLADGPTIAAAGQRALNNGMTLDGALALASGARDRGAAPILFFTYVNPIVQYGPARFAAAARAAGALGAIVPDVPLEELAAFAPAFRAEGLAIPLLVAPTTPPERAARIAAASDGFVYIVSRLGVTSAGREPDIAWIRSSVESLRAQTQRPLAVGFGISTPAHAAAIGAIADGVIVGSAFIDATAGRAGPAAAAAARGYVEGLREGICRGLADSSE
ncbi:MAG TPA: tryptophan synthase subunit alpha [Candidatus Lustribacter sp.]|nr:tryptophan synthase subunit alpha [Candidatus Lustribacter sp.]